MSNLANVINVSEATFERDVIQQSHEKPVVVDFWAAWCGPCRMLGPILEKLANEPGSNFLLAKVDVDVNPGLAMRYNVQGIPAVKAFHGGQVVGEFVGAQPEPRVRQFLKDIAPSEVDEKQKTVDDLIADRAWQEAEQLYREMLIKDPGNAEARLGLARTLVGQGRGSEAQDLLEELIHVPAVLGSAEKLLAAADFVALVEGQADDANLELIPAEAQYRQAARLLTRGKIAPAMDGLLDVLRYNKRYREGKAKEAMLGIFELLGDGDPLTSRYRRELASVLF
jgi:putative thioredoxin